MPTLSEIFNKKAWTAGIYKFPPLPFFIAGLLIPAGIEYVKLLLDVTQMTNPANFVKLSAEISFDGGVTFVWKESVSFQGGPIKQTDLSGKPITRVPPFMSYHEFHLPRPNLLNRRARITGEIIGPDVTLASTVEVR